MSGCSVDRVRLAILRNLAAWIAQHPDPRDNASCVLAVPMLLRKEETTRHAKA